MNNSDLLEKIGLSKNEASIYLALLELGVGTGYQIAQKTNIKRPTAYITLDSLQRKRLVARVPNNKKSLFTAESPELLLSDLNKKTDLVKMGLPELLAMHNRKKEKPQVNLFQGKEGVKQIYSEIFEAKEVLFCGTTEQTIKIYPEAIEDFINTFKKTTLKVRDIVTKSTKDREYVSLFKNEPRYQARFMNNSTFGDFAIFGDRAAFFSFRPEIFVLVITSKDVTQLLRNLYELAWTSAEHN